MRNRALHDALRDFALEAAALLTQDTRAGAEVEFDLAEQPAGGATLYRYRPLTDEFIAGRWPGLRALPTCERAGHELGAGARAYLSVRGAPGVDPEPALRAMLERLYEDATEFAFPEERFERVYEEVERTLFHDALTATVIAPMPGVRIAGERVELGDGLSLVRGDALEAPPEAVWLGTGEPGEGRAAPNVLCVLERAQPVEASPPLGEARERFARLLTAMRLLKRGRASLAWAAWARADTGAWKPVELGVGAPARGHAWELDRAEEAELRDLVGVLEGTRLVGPVAWALRRFELGCERHADGEALSDYLLALRALLDGEGDTGRASMGLRLAALCAEEPERQEVRRRLELAFALERLAVAGTSAEPYLDEIGPDGAGTLIAETEGYLRAILRDVVCGYLGADLKAAADDLLLRSGAPIEVKARDLRRHNRPRASASANGSGSADWEGSATATARDGNGAPAITDLPTEELSLADLGFEPFDSDRDREDDEASEPEVAGPPELAPAETPETRPGPRAGYFDRPSADAEFDEDPASYSAPV